ncbi:MAG: 4Fe-4S dicluster domain-containing protein [Candidatus Hodarchaeota archaeon]
MHSAATLSACYQCGTCTGGCPVAKETNGKYNPRKTIEKSLLGMKDQLINDPTIWLCTVCDTCDELCPQNVQLTHIFSLLKNIAAKEGYVPENFKGQSTAVFDYGVTIPYMDAILRRRKDLGLEENLEENIKVPIEELQTLMKATGFQDIVDKFKAEKEAPAEGQ